MKKYITIVLTGLFVTLLCVAVFNWFVNPFDLFDSPEYHGVNENKPEAVKYARLTKPYKMSQIKPDAMILGSSRGLAIPVDHREFYGFTAYNASLASGTIYELRRMFQHAMAQTKLRKVILALDEEFDNSVRVNFSEQRISVTTENRLTPDKNMKLLKDYFDALFSATALRSSLNTLRKQQENSETGTDSGTARERIKNAGGQRMMFNKMESGIINGAEKINANCINLSAAIKDENSVKSKDFEYIIAESYRNDIDLVIFLSPVHARFLEAKCIAGKWKQIEAHKRYIVQFVHDKAVETGKAPFLVWDFSGYNSITNEKVPELNDLSSIMKYYWEGSHYTRLTANYILDTIYTGNRYKNFGERITVDNIEAHLAMIRKSRESYLKSESQLQHELMNMKIK